jgi:hypothetical protein
MRQVSDKFPVSPGHALVIPRKVVARIYDLTSVEQAALWDLVRCTRQLLQDRSRVAEIGWEEPYGSSTVGRHLRREGSLFAIPFTLALGEKKGWSAATRKYCMSKEVR